jgi:hypothetical protein
MPHLTCGCAVNSPHNRTCGPRAVPCDILARRSPPILTPSLSFFVNVLSKWHMMSIDFCKIHLFHSTHDGGWLKISEIQKVFRVRYKPGGSVRITVVVRFCVVRVVWWRTHENTYWNVLVIHEIRNNTTLTFHYSGCQLYGNCEVG